MIEFANVNPITVTDIPNQLIFVDLEINNVPYKKIKLKNKKTASIETIL